MAFHFSLQAVLRFRESFERRECMRLQVITREVAKTRQEWEEAKQDRATASEQFTMKLKSGVAAMEIQFEQACDRSRLRRIAALKEQSEKLEDLRRRQMGVYTKAQQQRKILENLRDRQLAIYRLEQSRRTQQQMDEMFLLRRASHEVP